MISVVGTGPGAGIFITEAGRSCIENAEILIGAIRHLEQFGTGCPTYRIDGNLMNIVLHIRNNSDKNIVILASGDPNLYGIAGFLQKHFDINIISGISSVQYLFSKISLDMNDVYITSSHGRKPDFDLICAHKKVAMVTDNKIDPANIAKILIDKGCRKKMVIGENLSYENEKISFYNSLKEVLNTKKYDMNVVILYETEEC